MHDTKAVLFLTGFRCDLVINHDVILVAGVMKLLSLRICGAVGFLGVCFVLLFLGPVRRICILQRISLP